jgi:hypothetical protein
MLSRQACLSSGVTPRSFARHPRKNPAPASSDRGTPASLRPSSPTPGSVGRVDPRWCWVHSPSFAPPPVASTRTAVAALPRVPLPEPSHSRSSSSVLKPVAEILPANGTIFVSVFRTSSSPFAEECPNSDCLNLGEQSRSLRFRRPGRDGSIPHTAAVARITAPIARDNQASKSAAWLPRERWASSGHPPELNPVEYLWGYWKHHQVANVCPNDF